ncbi:MAG TPA: MmcQ/YjbR family DNA-binding protein [Rhizomicrobium sp.]|jgi:predicted DNA-binding protein (MmcQ/YjbR family)|nr:MmcQ/YjbR family DNA-binding protein [Rhizomicrobium sp.]
MTPKAIEKFLLALPGAKLSLQWGDDRVFKVGGKMFAVLSPSGSHARSMSFKASETSFHILTRMKNIIPAPYLARAHWVALEKLDALKPDDLKVYLMRAHALIAAKLTKKQRAALGLGETAKP